MTRRAVMFSKRKSWMLIFPIAVCLSLVSGFNAYGQRIRSITEERAREQERDNRQWESDATRAQREIYNRAEELFKNERYEDAFVLYRRVLNITYPYWDLGTVRRPVRPRGRDAFGPAPATSRSRKKLVTSLNTRAEDRIRSIRENVRDAVFVESFGDAKGLFDDGNLASAYSELKRLPNIRGVSSSTRSKYERQIDNMVGEIEKEAERLLDEMRQALDAEDQSALRNAHSEFQYKFGKFNEHEELSLRYRRITGASNFTHLMREEIAAGLLQEARAAFENEDIDTAVEMFTRIVNYYQDTAAAEEARVDLDTIYGDDELQRTVANERAREQCELWLRQAKNFVANGQIDQAQRRYNRIIEYYPDTDFAEEARKALEELE